MIRVRLKEAIDGKVYFLGKQDKSYGLAEASEGRIHIHSHHKGTMGPGHWWVPRSRAYVWTRERDLLALCSRARFEAGKGMLEIVHPDGSTTPFDDWFEKASRR